MELAVIGLIISLFYKLFTTRFTLSSLESYSNFFNTCNTVEWNTKRGDWTSNVIGLFEYETTPPI